MQGHQNKAKAHHLPKYTVYFTLDLSTTVNMVIKKIKLRNIACRSIDKVHFCYFNQGNLQVIDVKDLKITTGP